MFSKQIYLFILFIFIYKLRTQCHTQCPSQKVVSAVKRVIGRR